MGSSWFHLTIFRILTHSLNHNAFRKISVIDDQPESLQFADGSGDRMVDGQFADPSKSDVCEGGLASTAAGFFHLDFLFDPAGAIQDEMRPS